VYPEESVPAAQSGASASSAGAPLVAADARGRLVAPAGPASGAGGRASAPDDVQDLAARGGDRLLADHRDHVGLALSLAVE
jgi:hypothetical protein